MSWTEIDPTQDPNWSDKTGTPTSWGGIIPGQTPDWSQISPVPNSGWTCDTTSFTVDDGTDYTCDGWYSGLTNFLTPITPTQAAGWTPVNP